MITLSDTHTHTLTYTHTLKQERAQIRWDSSGCVIDPSYRPLTANTQHSQETAIHAPGLIRIRKANKRAALDRKAIGSG